jgi:hypothetical protein
MVQPGDFAVLLVTRATTEKNQESRLEIMCDDKRIAALVYAAANKQWIE